MVINFNANKLEFVTKLLGVNPITRKPFDEHLFNRKLKKAIYDELLASYEVFRREALDHIQTRINNEIIRCGLCKKVDYRFGDYLAHSVSFDAIVEEIRCRTVYEYNSRNYVVKAFHLCDLSEYLERASGISSLIDFDTVPDRNEYFKNYKKCKKGDVV